LTRFSYSVRRLVEDGSFATPDRKAVTAIALIKWVNTGRAERGLSLIEGHTKTWIKERAALSESLNIRLLLVLE
jgi:hypothetical protein